MIKIAICGWCRAKDLHNSKENGLEVHRIPGQRRTCDGPATSPYAGRITVRDIKGRAA